MNIDYGDPALPDRLRAFEQRIADAFNAGAIRAPVHLAGGNEARLISYFRNRYVAERGDWICAAWRSHYHCLLAGVDEERLFADILAGRSITLCYPDHRIISSAIVGGVLPIALGLALAVRRTVDAHDFSERAAPVVHAFVGDMTARGGTYHEVLEYASGHQLPLSIVVEDNGKSVGTPTMEAWGTATRGAWPKKERHIHELPWPHAGAGQWVRF